jgi:2-oxo-4-hydroxy-4-carboxy-5-ureidoimidazoline decarboxylase
MPLTISQVNQMSQGDFVETFGAVFEDTPIIATQTWNHRPFTDVHDLHQKMVDIVSHMTDDAKLLLIKAHPDLGSKAKMAEASVSEQSSVGLDRLSSVEYDKFTSLNKAYKEKFHFPFIIAVKNNNKSSILEAFEWRLSNDTESEYLQAVMEITQIAYFRLNAIFGLEE